MGSRLLQLSLPHTRAPMHVLRYSVNLVPTPNRRLWEPEGPKSNSGPNCMEKLQQSLGPGPTRCHLAFRGRPPRQARGLKFLHAAVIDPPPKQERAHSRAMCTSKACQAGEEGGWGQSQVSRRSWVCCGPSDAWVRTLHVAAPWGRGRPTALAP